MALIILTERIDIMAEEMHQEIIGVRLSIANFTGVIAQIEPPGERGGDYYVNIKSSSGDTKTFYLQTVLRSLGYSSTKTLNFASYEKSKIIEDQCWACGEDLNSANGDYCKCHVPPRRPLIICPCGACLPPEYFSKRHRDLRCEINPAFKKKPIVPECTAQIERMGFSKYQERLEDRFAKLVKRRERIFASAFDDMDGCAGVIEPGYP